MIDKSQSPAYDCEKFNEEYDKSHMNIGEKPLIGIVTALPKEYAAVKTLLQNIREQSKRGSRATRRYLLGEVPIAQGSKHLVVLALLPNMGTNSAAICASYMLEDFSSVRDILMVGIAGGVPNPENPDEHVRLGDIVVSNEYGIIQYDFAKETIAERIPRPFPRPPSPELLQAMKLLQAAELAGESPWQSFIDQAANRLKINRPSSETDQLASSTDPKKIIPHPEDKKRHPDQPRVFAGSIAASNTLLKNPLLRDKLRDQHNAKAIEMESSGIADATWKNRAGYLVIRGICDYCDTNKGEDWQAYATIVAAAYMRALLASIPADEPYPPDTIDFHQTIPTGQENAFDVEVVQQNLLKLPLDSIPEVASLPPGSRMPYRYNPHFVGRKTEMQTLAKFLKGSAPVTRGQGESVVAAGIGGIGKTQLVSEFVHRYGQYFSGGVFWLDFAHPDTIPSEVANCSDMLDLKIYSNFASLPLDEKVRLICSAWQSSLPRLLVFDNCNDEQLLNQWRPRTGGCRVLVTSLRQKWSSDLGIKILPLECLEREESLQLLCEYRNDLSIENSDLDSIADELGDLPLALHLAGKFLERYRHASVGTPGVYLAKLRQVRPLRHRSLQDEGTTWTTHHLQHVEQTFALSYEQLETENPIDQEALRLLSRIRYFSPGIPIPHAILLHTLGEMHEIPDMEILAEDAVEKLLSLGLLDSLEDGALRMHRLISEFVESRMDTDRDAESAVEQIVCSVAVYLYMVGLPKDLSALQPHIWTASEPAKLQRDLSAGLPRDLSALQLHLRTVTERAKPRKDLMAARLCNAWAFFLMKIGAMDESRIYLEYEREILKQNPKQDPEEYVTMLNNLAQVYQAQEDIGQAQNLAQQALEFGEQVLGSEHLLVTDSLDILAVLYGTHNQPEEAEKLLKKSLKIRERLLKPDDPDIAIVLDYLGHALLVQKRYTEAEEYFQRTLAIMKKKFGGNHPGVAASLTSFAGLYFEQQLYKQAEQFYRDALKIEEQALGPDHFEVALDLDRLAVCYGAQKRYAEAVPLFKRALNILEHTPRVPYRFVTQILDHAVKNYIAQGDFDSAESLLFRTVEDRGGIFVFGDSSVAQSLEFVAWGYNQQKKYAKVVVLLEQALMINEQIKGPGHPDTVRVETLVRETQRKQSQRAETA